MDIAHFDRPTRSLSMRRSRRILTGALSLGMVGLPGLGEARKKRRKRKKKVRFNDFGCVNVGSFCKNNDQCCSGICEGRKGKKRCQAHDQTTCQAGQREYFCGGIETNCTTSTGAAGFCNTTTGNAGYCSTANAGVCAACTKDADCVPICGPQAACIACAACGETGGVGCDGPEVEGCLAEMA